TICAIESVLPASAFLSDLQHFRNLLLVLAAVAEAMRSLGPLLDLVLQPSVIAVLVCAPRLPLAAIVGKHCFVHHRHATRNGAYGFANSATATRHHVGVVQALRGHV